MSYFENLQGKKVQSAGYLLQHMQRIEDTREILKHHDDIDVKEAYKGFNITLAYCHQLLQNEYRKEERSYIEWEYKETDGTINPRGNEIHIPKDFILLQDSEGINGSIKLYAHFALMELNGYYRYLSRLSIERNKYKAHRRAIHKLDPDIELPRLPAEIFKDFEDRTRNINPTQYQYFLNAMGVKRSPKRSEYEKLLKQLSDPRYIKDR